MDIEDLNGSLTDMSHLSDKSECFKLAVTDDDEDSCEALLGATTKATTKSAARKASLEVGRRRRLSAVTEDFLYGFDNGEAVLGPNLKKSKPTEVVVAAEAEKMELDDAEIVLSITAESTRPTTPPPPPAVEPPSTPKSSPTVAAAAAKHAKPAQKLITDELFLAPFEFGWKRELVYRAVPDVTKENKGEVYYISPTGKKCRTKNEISHFLGASDLTVESFTFAKEPIGLGGEKEIVRNAKPNNRLAAAATTTPEVVAKRVATAEVLVTGKRVSKPKVPKGASPPPQGWTPTRALKPNTPVSRVLATSRAASHDNENKPSVGKAQATPKASSKVSKKNGEPCTMQCIRAMGKVPQLQCVKCLCLFHHECVGLDCDASEFRLMSPNGQDGNVANGGRRDYVCESCMPIVSNNHIDKKESSSSRRSSRKNSVSINSNGGRQSNAATRATTKQVKEQSMPQSIVVINNKKYIAIQRPEVVVGGAGVSPPDGPKDTENQATTDAVSHVTANDKKRGAKSVEVAAPAPGNQNLITYSTANFLGNVAMGYDVLILTFQYLKVQELLRCSRVCRLWNLLANHRNLWRTVRMKNSQVNDWSGFAAALRRNETYHLDLRKMLVSTVNFDEMWTEFSEHISTVVSLKEIDFCRCPSQPVQQIFKTNRNLRVINANAIKDENLNLENLQESTKLEELRLKSGELINLDGDLSPLQGLVNLTHLSLTSFKDLASKNFDIIGELVNLKSLEFGECNSLKEDFAENVLAKLTNLQHLRLESSGDDCCTNAILEQVAAMSTLTQLELVNFDVRPGFDDKIAECKNIRKLLIIPTYVSQSATTNHVVLKSVLRLADTLDVFTWAVTLELMRVTALYVVQCDDKKKKDKRQFDESIPILKPVPGSGDLDSVTLCTGLETVPQIEILPLENVENILTRGLTRTKFKIMKIAHSATWKQGIVE